ncbi:hypothetical protein J6590_040868 [Homalodisca vitripennis]|nr:hypothetical protein J6590_040868 [Homalodisca vitripennis]
MEEEEVLKLDSASVYSNIVFCERPLDRQVNKTSRLDSPTSAYSPTMRRYVTPSRHSCFEVNKNQSLLATSSAYSQTSESPQ